MYIVDLSHPLTSGKQRFRLDVSSYPVDEYIPGYLVAEGEWYIMQEVNLCTHVGTHVEAPFHAIKNGIKAGELDYRSLIGPASVVDFTDKKHNDPITMDELKNRGAGIRSGDIVLIKTGISKYYGTTDYKRPYIETEAVDWLVQQGIKCLGIDCSGIENKQVNSKQINHRKIFMKNIPLIEDLNNLDKLKSERVFFIASTLPIKGLDASPIRPLAIEPLEECEPLIDIFLGSDTFFIK
jgi:arylformamidase